jgi:type I restriction enzyme S subunit
MALNRIRIGDYIEIINERNSENLDLPFYGINKDKEFMPTVATTNNLDKSKYKIMKKGRFVFSGMQTGRDMCIRIGLYENEFDSLISPAYTTFEVNSNMLLPDFLFMLFRSKEMDRYGAFLSDGSVRANLDWDVFVNMKFDTPPIDIQKKYVGLYRTVKLNLANNMVQGLEINDICPILIKGAIEEGGR